METEGSKILDEAVSFIQRFSVLPSEATAHTIAVWAAHSHAYKAFERSPRLAFLSDLPASGKTLTMTLTGLLSLNAKTMSDHTPARFALAATLGRTLALDETDTIFRSNASAPKLQAVYNDGWQSKGTSDKIEGGKLVSYSIFCPVVLAGLNNLPRACQSRTIIVRMEQRRREQRIEPWQSRMHEPIGKSIGEALGSWAEAHTLDLAAAWPDLPDGVADREAEKWLPLLAVADVAGGPWPERIAKACDEFVNGIAAEPAIPPLAQLLADIQSVWCDDRMSSPELCRRLRALDGARWGTIWPESAAPRELAAMLRTVGVHPRKMRINNQPLQGYDRKDFVPLWNSTVPAASAV